MEIVWSRHAEEHQKEWEQKLSISRQEVEDLLSSPQQVVSGDLDAFSSRPKRKWSFACRFCGDGTTKKDPCLVLDQ